MGRKAWRTKIRDGRQFKSLASPVCHHGWVWDMACSGEAIRSASRGPRRSGVRTARRQSKPAWARSRQNMAIERGARARTPEHDGSGRPPMPDVVGDAGRPRAPSEGGPSGGRVGQGTKRKYGAEASFRFGNILTRRNGTRDWSPSPKSPRRERERVRTGGGWGEAAGQTRGRPGVSGQT
jgi:hypothetical protein